MNRRDFLQRTSAAGLLTLITPTEIIHAMGRPQVATPLQTGFLNPPASARPHTWWHWMNGHVTQDGITRDLEAMQRVGIGGFQNFSVGSGIPIGPVEYGSAEWLRLMQHTIREADRLGLEFQMHNCPGWSSSGGPWITPERTMQQVTWSETVVRGGKKQKINLPEPFKRLNYYRDVAVLAFPAPAGERQTWSDTLTSISTPAGPVDKAQLVAGTGPGLEIAPTSATQPGTLLLAFSAPFEARSVLIYTAAPASLGGGRVLPVGPIGVEVSDDGTSFRKVAELPLVITETPGAASFAPVRAKFFRLTLPLAARVMQVRLSGATRLNDWTTKANFAGGQPGVAGMAASAAPGPAVPADEIIDPTKLIDLTKLMQPDGQLDWKAPAGDWVVLRLGHTATDRINKAAPTTGQGLECDKFSREAFDFHFHQMFDQLLPALKAMHNKSKVGLLIDSYEVGMQNWTVNFPQDFQASRGYELLHYLPAMTGRVIGNEELTEKFLWDMRRTQADLMANNYYGRCAELCHENGFLAYTEPYNGGPFEQLQAGSRMDVNMGEFWVRTLRFRHSLKVASSVQHINGRAVVGAEAFTGDAVHSKWQEHPYSLKADGDYMFTLGLNRMIFHRYAHQPHPTARPGMTMGPWGIHMDRTNTWFETGAEWFKYLARCQYLLQQGQFVADLLYLTADDAPGEDVSLRPAPNPAPPVGYDYDNINVETLLKRATVADGQLALPEGQRYRLLVLPLRPTMSLLLLRKLRELVGQGLSILGPKPQRSASLVGGPAATAEWQRLADELWSGAGPELRVGQGRVFVGQPVQQVLNMLQTPPDFEFSARSSDPAINYLHRRLPEGEVYFVANRKRRPETLVATFRVAGRRPEFWNAATGEAVPAAVYESANGRTRVALELEPAGSVFVVFREAAPARQLRSVAKDGRVVLGLAAFPAAPMGQHRDTVNTFTISAWVKPECDITIPDQPTARFGVASFAFFPAEGETLYGPGHAVAGVRIGRNAVIVHERVRDITNAVLVLQKPTSGWTHLALVYQSGVPLVYLNGELIGQGKASGRQVHPGLGDERPDGASAYFEGDMGTPQLDTQALSATQVRALAATPPPAPLEPPVLQPTGAATAGILFWQNGAYTLQDQAGRSTTLKITTLPRPVELAGSWQVSFSENLGAPATATLPRLQSLHLHSEPGIKYFSGTATYRKTLRAAKPASGQRLYLDLGAVAVLAEVVLNGKPLATLWKPPFRLDITDTVQPGDNQLEVRVTNLWPNRLIGDKQQPAEYDYSGEAFGQKGGITAMPAWYVQGQPKPASARVAFTTWQHYCQDSPLLESGLIGPVRLLVAAQPAAV